MEQKKSNSLDPGFYLDRNPSSFRNISSRQRFKKKSSLGIIHEKWEVIPYLSIKDNLLLGTSKNQRRKLDFYIEISEIAPCILSEIPEILTPLDFFKCQVVHELLLDKKTIVISPFSDTLTTHEIQWFLPYCQTLAKSCQIVLILFSDNQLFLETPYIDGIL